MKGPTLHVGRLHPHPGEVCSRHVRSRKLRPLRLHAAEISAIEGPLSEVSELGLRPRHVRRLEIRSPELRRIEIPRIMPRDWFLISAEKFAPSRFAATIEAREKSAVSRPSDRSAPSKSASIIWSIPGLGDEIGS